MSAAFAATLSLRDDGGTHSHAYYTPIPALHKSYERTAPLVSRNWKEKGERRKEKVHSAIDCYVRVKDSAEQYTFYPFSFLLFPVSFLLRHDHANRQQNVGVHALFARGNDKAGLRLRGLRVETEPLNRLQGQAGQQGTKLAENSRL